MIALTARVEPGLVAQRGEQQLESFAEGIVAEVLETGLRDGGSDDAVDIGHH